jgi:hypothetical protein
LTGIGIGVTSEMTAYLAPLIEPVHGTGLTVALLPVLPLTKATQICSYYFLAVLIRMNYEELRIICYALKTATKKIVLRTLGYGNYVDNDFTATFISLFKSIRDSYEDSKRSATNANSRDKYHLDKYLKKKIYYIHYLQEYFKKYKGSNPPAYPYYSYKVFAPVQEENTRTKIFSGDKNKYFRILIEAIEALEQITIEEPVSPHDEEPNPSLYDDPELYDIRQNSKNSLVKEKKLTRQKRLHTSSLEPSRDSSYELLSESSRDSSSELLPESSRDSSSESSTEPSTEPSTESSNESPTVPSSVPSTVPSSVPSTELSTVPSTVPSTESSNESPSEQRPQIITSSSIVRKKIIPNESSSALMKNFLEAFKNFFIFEVKNISFMLLELNILTFVGHGDMTSLQKHIYMAENPGFLTAKLKLHLLYHVYLFKPLLMTIDALLDFLPIGKLASFDIIQYKMRALLGVTFLVGTTRARSLIHSSLVAYVFVYKIAIQRDARFKHFSPKTYSIGLATLASFLGMKDIASKLLRFRSYFLFDEAEFLINHTKDGFANISKMIQYIAVTKDQVSFYEVLQNVNEESSKRSNIVASISLITSLLSFSTVIIGLSPNRILEMIASLLPILILLYQQNLRTDELKKKKENAGQIYDESGSNALNEQLIGIL